MHCEHAKDLMFEYIEDNLSEEQRRSIGEHLEGCADCREAYAGALMVNQFRDVWHDEAPPAWQPPRIAREPRAWPAFQQWFPTLASAAALALVVLMYVDRPSNPLPNITPLAAAPVPTEAQESMMVQNVLESSRTQRQRELEALVKLLKAEMDRRSIETEESLRYVIAHQIQEQQELEDLRRKVQHITEPEADGQPTPEEL